MEEHLYIVAYDISDKKRWRRVFKMMHGYGEWLQLSIFQCRLSAKSHAEMIALLDEMINHNEDHLISMDFGPADKVPPRVTSLGKTYETIEKSPTIV